MDQLRKHWGNSPPTLSELPHHYDMVPLGAGARQHGRDNRSPFRLPQLQTRRAERYKVHSDARVARQTGIPGFAP